MNDLVKDESQNLIKQSDLPKYHFLGLGTARVRQEKLSDHEPVIDQDVLSWNIMMRGKYNLEKNRYNNGFELIETPQQYQQRLHQIAYVLAQCCDRNPNINVICLQEAPIEAADIAVFVDACLVHSALQKFKTTLNDPRMFEKSWGLITLLNTHNIQYQPLKFKINKDILSAEDCPKLESRIQPVVYQDIKTKNTWSIFNVYLPFDLAKNKPQKMASIIGTLKAFENRYAYSSLIVAGDFNFPVMNFDNLKKLGQLCSPKNNSTECHGIENRLESVDAIISNRALERLTIRDIRWPLLCGSKTTALALTDADSDELDDFEQSNELSMKRSMRK